MTRDTAPGELLAILVLSAAVLLGLILQGGRPIPSSGTCKHPCVIVELGR